MISDKTKEISEKIKEVIKKKGLSQKEVSIRAGVSEEQVSRLMNGKNEPLYVTIVKIAAAMDVPMQALFDDDIETSKLIQDIIKKLPSDIVEEMTYANNDDLVMVGFKGRDMGLTAEEMEDAFRLFKTYKKYE